MSFDWKVANFKKNVYANLGDSLFLAVRRVAAYPKYSGALFIPAFPKLCSADPNESATNSPGYPWVSFCNGFELS